MFHSTQCFDMFVWYLHPYLSYHEFKWSITFLQDSYYFPDDHFVLTDFHNRLEVHLVIIYVIFLNVFIFLSLGKEKTLSLLLENGILKVLIPFVCYEFRVIFKIFNAWFYITGYSTQCFIPYLIKAVLMNTSLIFLNYCYHYF